jgi:hypothetical protein
MLADRSSGFSFSFLASHQTHTESKKHISQGIRTAWISNESSIDWGALAKIGRGIA